MKNAVFTTPQYTYNKINCPQAISIFKNPLGSQCFSTMASMDFKNEQAQKKDNKEDNTDEQQNEVNFLNTYS